MSKKTKESILLGIEKDHRKIDEILFVANRIKLGVDVAIGTLQFAKAMATTMHNFDLHLRGSEDLGGLLADLVKNGDGNAVAIAVYSLSTMLREAAYEQLPGYSPDFEASAKLTQKTMITMVKTVKGHNVW